MVADHNSRVYGPSLVPIERFHIPGLILGGPVKQPQRITTLASQIDLAPTLVSLMGLSGERPWIGRDLSDPAQQQRPGRAIMQFDKTQAYMEGNDVAVLQPDTSARTMRYEQGQLRDNPVGNPALISRTHFARFLVETGVCKDTPEVFRKYLTEGKPGYVPHRWASLGDAVRWITEAGGMAVIAHPARYKFSANEEYALFSEFKQHGGRSVEVVTGSHSAAEYVTYAAMAQEFGLAASRGSDFHSPDESHTDLGTLPFLPGQLTPVWELLDDKILR